MYALPLERINELNEEIKNKIPNLDYNSHLLASSINLMISGNYFEGYKIYREFSQNIDNIDTELDLKIINFVSSKLIRDGNLNEARAILQEKTNIYPTESSLVNNLAVVLFKLNQPQLAYERLAFALRLDPDNMEIRNNYEKIVKYLKLEEGC
ncbi:hypothetical protein ABCY62_06205 [Acetivibrio clariflavus]|uniref:hypothetical protein n=1 Tax=Acetivibrio clariflavus TaxID=288965 RepID=UPI0031F5C54A